MKVDFFNSERGQCWREIDRIYPVEIEGKDLRQLLLEDINSGRLAKIVFDDCKESSKTMGELPDLKKQDGLVEKGMVRGFAGIGLWWDINEPVAIAYLASLKSSDIGRKLEGVLMSDGDYMFVRYFGRVDKPEIGAHICILGDEKRKDAYIWVDENGVDFPLPKCNDGTLINAGAYSISTDVYTWPTVEPGCGPVRYGCPEEEWLRLAK